MTTAPQPPESAAVAGEVWQETDGVLLLCVTPNERWQDFNGASVPWDASTISRPLRRLLDSAGRLVVDPLPALEPTQARNLGHVIDVAQSQARFRGKNEDPRDVAGGAAIEWVREYLASGTPETFRTEARPFTRDVKRTS